MGKRIVAFIKRELDFLVANEWIVILLFVIFLLRVPTLFEPNWYGDEEIYLVMGQGLRKGLVFYRDIFDHKPPIIYILAAITQTVFWFRMLLLFAHGVAVVYFARLADLVLKNKAMVWISTSLYALFSTLPTLEGTIANGENFMTVPALIGAYMVYRASLQEKVPPLKTWLGVGVWFGLAFLVKVPIGFDFLAVGLFWWLFAEKKLTITKAVRRLFSTPIMGMLAGFGMLVALTTVYYWSVGAFEPFVRSALLQNIGYIESWRGSEEASSPLSNPLVWRMLVILAVGLVALELKRQAKLSKEVLFLSMWWLLSVYGALLSNRPYPHYLLQPLLPGVLLLGLLIDQVLMKKWKNTIFLGLLSAGVGIVLLSDVGFWHYPTVPYYKNFLEYAVGKKNYEEYKAFFPANLKRNEKVAEYLRDRTTPNEHVFVWGEEPAIYDMADRLPVGRYIVSFHIRDFPNGFAETMTKLANEKPRYIVVIPSQVPEFPALTTMLATDYLHVETIDDALVYMRLEPKLVLNSL